MKRSCFADTVRRRGRPSTIREVSDGSLSCHLCDCGPACNDGMDFPLVCRCPWRRAGVTMPLSPPHPRSNPQEFQAKSLARAKRLRCRRVSPLQGRRRTAQRQRLCTGATGAVQRTADAIKRSPSALDAARIPEALSLTLRQERPREAQRPASRLQKRAIVRDSVDESGCMLLTSEERMPGTIKLPGSTSRIEC